MKTLITGASGLLGNHLTRQLLSRGHQVRILVESEEAAQGLDDMEVERFVADIRDPEQVKGCAIGMDVLIHAAACTATWPRYSKKAFEVNVSGTDHMINEALESGVHRFIYVSSACAFGWGPDRIPGTEYTRFRRFNYRIDYYETKHLAQDLVLKAVRDRKLPGIVVNPTFMIGPYDFNMNGAGLIHSIVTRKVPGFPPGGRNFVHAGDVAAAIVNAIELGVVGECYILGNENLSYRDFFRMVGKVTCKRVPVLPIPALFVLLIAAFQSMFAAISGNPPQLSFNMARGTCRYAYYSADKGRQFLHLPQTPISVAIYETMKWLKLQYPDHVV